jgi:hypothetical protein
MLESFDTDQWYWDPRTGKALYPRAVDGETVEFVTVWHAEEVTDALDNEALLPVESVGLERTDTTFDLLESFRMPPHLETGPSDGADRTDSEGGEP